MRKLKSTTFHCVWDALEKNPKTASDLRARSELICELRNVIRAQHWQPSEAAAHYSVSEARINDVIDGRIDRLSLAMLRAMAIYPEGLKSQHL